MPNTRASTNWLLWGAVLSVALGVRMGAAVWWQQRLDAVDAQFAFGDSDSYWFLARQIFEGEPFYYGGPESKLMRMPGYPILLSTAFFISGREPPVLLGRLVGAVAGVFAVAGVTWCGQQLFDQRAGALGGLIAAVYPGGVATSVFILSEALFCPLLIGQAVCWVMAIRAGSTRGRRAWSLAAGLFSAAAVYSRPSWLLFPLFLTLVGLLLDIANRRRQLEVGAVAIALTVLLMIPWWVRSYNYTGHFVLTTLEMGASLYDGLNPAADGGSNMDFKRGFYERQAEEDPNATPGQFAYRVDRRMRREAWAWAAANPGAVARLAVVKMIRLWSPWPNAGEFRSLLMRLVVALGFLPLLAAAVYGAWRYRSTHGAFSVILFAPAFYISGLHLVFVSSIRYRQPAMLLAAVLAGAAVNEIWMRLERKPQDVEPA